jgi:hypothetical protein
MATISGSVGRGGKNARPDVQVVQQLLNADLPSGVPPLDVDGNAGPKTIAAITEYQRKRVTGVAATGVVSPFDSTWRVLSSGKPSGTPTHTFIPPRAPAETAWPAKFTFEEFWSFSEPLEGNAANYMFMVQDLQVATGMGITWSNKANRNTPSGLPSALTLQWHYKPEHPNHGAVCSPEDVAKDYDEVLKHDDLGRLGPGQAAQWQNITQCRLTRETIKKAVRARVISNFNGVKARADVFGDFTKYPADAQLCVISLTWGVGPNFFVGYPKFCAACKAGRWLEAAKEATFKNQENTLPQRQRAQQLMMRNAEAVRMGEGDPDNLQWPAELTIPILARGFRINRELGA